MEWLLMLLPWGLFVVLLPVVIGGVRGAMADPEPFVVQFELSGSGVQDGASFLLRVEPSWAPRGAKRFRELVEAGFYDDTRFFRVLDGMYDIWIAQFGVRLVHDPRDPPSLCTRALFVFVAGGAP